MSDHLQPHALAQLALSFTESSRRAELEQVIAQGLATFITVGNALWEIRDSRLYRDTHETFEDYCRERWGMTINYADRLMLAAKTVRNLETVPIGILPSTESQVRPLAGLEPEQQREVWDAAVKSAPNGKVTAAHVAEVIKAVRPAPSAAALTKATNRILAVCGKTFQAEVRGRLTPEESVQLSKLTDAEMLKVKTLMLRGWVFLEALRDVIDELEPDDNIRALLTRACRAAVRIDARSPALRSRLRTSKPGRGSKHD
jgi:hypothetical protein